MPFVMSSTDDLVRVVFELPEPDYDGTTGERLWATKVEEDLFELQNSPWHARTVNWLDVVEAVPDNDDEWPKFVKVVSRSGHRTIHLHLLENGRAIKQEILDRCNQLGATYEEADGRLYALDFAPGVDLAPAIQYFETLKSNDVADWRINDY